jgi:hypothetical protein
MTRTSTLPQTIESLIPVLCTGPQTRDPHSNIPLTHLVRGRMKPFIGSKTREKTSSRLLALERTDYALKDALRMA